MQLSVLYPLLTSEQRTTLASVCEISPGYLWQLATRWKGKRPTVDLLARLAKADERLSVEDLVQEFAESIPQVHVQPDSAPAEVGNA